MKRGELHLETFRNASIHSKLNTTGCLMWMQSSLKETSTRKEAAVRLIVLVFQVCIQSLLSLIGYFLYFIF